MAHISTSSVCNAVIENNIRKLSLLIKSGNRVDIQDNLGNTPLHHAARKLKRGCLNLLLRHKDCPVNARNYSGCTSLFLICENRSATTNIVKDLLSGGADPNIPNTEDILPLHVVCGNGNLEIAKLLVQRGADINAQDFDKYTPLMHAVHTGKKTIVEFLLQCNADVTLVEDHGLNPLMMSVVKTNEEIFDVLLPVTGNLNAREKLNETVLTLAVKVGSFSMVEKLVEGGADVNCDGAESPLTVPELYEAGNLNIFLYIWKKLDHYRLFHNSSINIWLLRYLRVVKHLSHLKIIFETINFTFSVEQLENFFEFIFHNQIDATPEFFNINKSDLLFIIDGILKETVLVSYEGYTMFLYFIQFCPYRLELFNKVLNNVEFQVDEKLLLNTFEIHPDLGTRLLQNCSYHIDISNLLTLFNQCSTNVDCTKIILKFCTPSDKIIQELLGVTEFNRRPKSLLEVSRDAVRRYIGENLSIRHEFREFKIKIQGLNCPQVVKDILLLKTPINTIL